MNKFSHSMMQLCERNRDGSYGTQQDRSKQLSQVGNELRELGYRHVVSMNEFKPKHVFALVKQWQEKGLNTGTIKNRMSNLRWAAEKTGNQAKVNSSNSFYGIEDRTYLTNEDKSLQFKTEQINQIDSPYIAASALLQREFGLRREEAMKFTPAFADKGTHVELKASWCKGGRGRSIPITTPSQRKALLVARDIAGKGSLIPNATSYVQHMRKFENEMRAVGLGHSHGARHAYAHRRYEELTGRTCPAQGGKKFRDLTQEEKTTDKEARLVISSELGHARESITNNYLGR